MEKQVVVFESMEPKKHSLCFKTSDKDAAVQSIYLMRTAFTEEPKRIKVTIEEI